VGPDYQTRMHLIHGGSQQTGKKSPHLQHSPPLNPPCVQIFVTFLIFKPPKANKIIISGQQTKKKKTNTLFSSPLATKVHPHSITSFSFIGPLYTPLQEKMLKGPHKTIATNTYFKVINHSSQEIYVYHLPFHLSFNPSSMQAIGGSPQEIWL